MIVHILSLNDDDDDAKALPTGVLKDDAMKKGGRGGQNVSKSDGVILVCSLTQQHYAETEVQSTACVLWREGSGGVNLPPALCLGVTPLLVLLGFSYSL